MVEHLRDNSYYGIPPQEELEKQKLWLDGIEAMLMSYRKYEPNRQLINEFLDANFEFNVYEHYAFVLTQDLMVRMQCGITQKDKQFNVDYFRILYKFYMMFNESIKCSFHREFVDEWQYHKIDYCPYYETCIPDFKEKLEKILDAVSLNLEEVEPQAMEDLRWSLLVSPVTTLLKWFQRVIKIRSQAAFDFTNTLCRSVGALFYDRDLKIYHNELETDKVEPLLAVVIRRFICCCRCEPTDEDDWFTLAHLIISFGKGDKPLLNCWTLLEVMLNELYTMNRTPISSIEMLSGVAALILEPENEIPSEYKFATSMRTQRAENLWLTPTIVDMLLKLMSEYHENKNSVDVIENSKLMLKYIGIRLQKKGAKFDQETKDHLMKTMTGMPWYVQYSVSTWYSLVDVNKRRIPTAIFKAIYPNSEMIKVEDKSSESTKKKPEGTVTSHEVVFEEIKVESEPEIPEVDLPEAYLRSIVELGIFDPECAYQLLCIEPTVRFQPTDLELLVKKLLVECYNANIGLRQIDHVRSMLAMILEVFDTTGILDYDNIVEPLIAKLSAPVIKPEWPVWTHNLMKSVPMEALKPLVKSVSKPPWPPIEGQQSFSIWTPRNRANQTQEPDKTHSIAQNIRENSQEGPYGRYVFKPSKKAPKAVSAVTLKAPVGPGFPSTPSNVLAEVTDARIPVGSSGAASSSNSEYSHCYGSSPSSGSVKSPVSRARSVASATSTATSNSETKKKAALLKIIDGIKEMNKIYGTTTEDAPNVEEDDRER